MEFHSQQSVKPDGTNETLGPITSDPVGGAYTILCTRSNRQL